MKTFLLAVLLCAAMSETYALSSNWYERFNFGGHFRYRHERKYSEGNAIRNRERLRFRLDVAAKVEENVTLHGRLESGGNNDIAFANQTFTGAGNNKPWNIDMAYVDWDISEKLQFRAGKMKKPYHIVGGGASAFMWAWDYSPEGTAFLYKNKISDKFKVFSNAGVIWLQERAADDDAYQLFGQIGFTSSFSQADLTLTYSHYNYKGVAHFSSFETNARGNSVLAGANTYLYNYYLNEAAAELNFKTDLPFSLYGNYVKNEGAPTENSGYLIGATVGSSAPKHFKFFYDYRKIEKDAMMANFSDPDFSQGGTDAKGHQFKIHYGFTKNIFSRVQLYVNKEDLTAPETKDLNIIFVDTTFKF